MRFDVYVPTDPQNPDPSVAGIDPGSGIVGTVKDGGRLLVDYEGNRNGSTNIVTYADRVHHAADRHNVSYPTIARRLVDLDSVTRIGSFDSDTGEVDLEDGEVDAEAGRTLLATWTGVPPGEVDQQLLTAGSAHHQMRREVIAGLTSHDPATRFAAQQMNKRYRLGLR